MRQPASSTLGSRQDAGIGFWTMLALAFAALALLVMWPRWGGTVEDSLAYFNTARYLRGEVPLSALRAPFPYRLAMPALAAAWPGDLRQGFATLNWLATTGTALVLARTAYVLGGDQRRVVLAGLLAILSVPTFW